MRQNVNRRSVYSTLHVTYVQLMYCMYKRTRAVYCNAKGLHVSILFTVMRTMLMGVREIAIVRVMITLKSIENLDILIYYYLYLHPSLIANYTFIPLLPRPALRLLMDTFLTQSIELFNQHAE